MKQTFTPYRSKTLSDFVPLNETQDEALDRVQKYLNELDDMRTGGRGLTFLGPNGVGKTMLASIVLNEVSRREYRVEAIELAEYVGLHKHQFALSHLMKSDDDYDDKYVKVSQHIRYIRGLSRRSADWVLFDDVSREYEADSGWSESEFFNAIRSRWNRGLPTIVTTNSTMPDLEQRYTAGLPSLLKESSELILILGDDYRCRKES